MYVACVTEQLSFMTVGDLQVGGVGAGGWRGLDESYCREYKSME